MRLFWILGCLGILSSAVSGGLQSPSQSQKSVTVGKPYQDNSIDGIDLAQLLHQAEQQPLNHPPGTLQAGQYNEDRSQYVSPSALQYAAPAPAALQYGAPGQAPAQQLQYASPAPAQLQYAAPAPQYNAPAPAQIQYAAPAPAQIQYAAPAPAQLQYAAPAPAQEVQYAAPAPAQIQYAAPAPAPQYAAPAPAPVQYAAPAPAPSQQYGAVPVQQYSPAPAQEYSPQGYYPATQATQARYAAPAPQTGYASPAPQTGYASPAPQTGYASPAPQGGYAAPAAPQSGYGTPAPARPQGGYAAPAPQGGYGAPGGPQGGGLNDGPIIRKHISIHVPPPEASYPRAPRPNIVYPKPEKHYKIIFIKAPSAPRIEPQDLPVIPPQPEQKTLVYVLVKKPEPLAPFVIPTAAPTTASKPEVYFIRYKGASASGGPAGNAGDATDLAGGYAGDQAYNAPQQPQFQAVQPVYAAPQPVYAAPQQSFAVQQQAYAGPQQAYGAPQLLVAAPQQSYAPQQQQGYLPPQQSYGPPPQQGYLPPQQGYSASVNRPVYQTPAPTKSTPVSYNAPKAGPVYQEVPNTRLNTPTKEYGVPQKSGY